MAAALFLDVDGVLNRLGDQKHGRTKERFDGFIGLDSELLPIYRAMIARLDATVVLSSTWRLLPEHRDHLKSNGIHFADVTPCLNDPSLVRGHEIAAWLMEHPEIERYAIIDDDSDMLPHQLPHFFQTDTTLGITQEIADGVVAHLTA